MNAVIVIRLPATYKTWTNTWTKYSRKKSITSLTEVIFFWRKNQLPWFWSVMYLRNFLISNESFPKYYHSWNIIRRLGEKCSSCKHRLREWIISMYCIMTIFLQLWIHLVGSRYSRLHASLSTLSAIFYNFHEHEHEYPYAKIAKPHGKNGCWNDGQKHSKGDIDLGENQGETTKAFVGDFPNFADGGFFFVFANMGPSKKCSRIVINVFVINCVSCFVFIRLEMSGVDSFKIW